jgi:hypothetical protein
MNDNLKGDLQTGCKNLEHTLIKAGLFDLNNWTPSEFKFCEEPTKICLEAPAGVYHIR